MDKVEQVLRGVWAGNHGAHAPMSGRNGQTTGGEMSRRSVGCDRLQDPGLPK